MNLAQSTRLTLEELELIPKDGVPTPRAFPWRQSKGLGRREEDVRPIFWKNRNKAYVKRTQDWDEFPNGRWGDARSPAFGHLDTYGVGLRGTNEQNIKLWGSPESVRDVTHIFLKFLNKEIDKLPWSETGLSAEVEGVQTDLITLNTRGFLTINSQPAVNGAASSDPVHGWGPSGGYCYQKAYLELLVPPSIVDSVISRVKAHEDLTFYAVNKAGNLKTNAPSDEPNAVTWGVFPGKEIVQPTIVETISFLAWKDEAFRLGEDWARCHSLATPTRHLLSNIMENWYLVNIVNNDFHHTAPIFDVFEGLEVENMDRKFDVPQTNGHH
jgi:methylenetetrahydrofolate reductase (NADPH)